MMISVLREWYLLGGVLFALASALAPLATAQGAPPDFSAGEAGWVITGGEFAPVAGSPSPVRQDPAYHYVANASGSRTTMTRSSPENTHSRRGRAAPMRAFPASWSIPCAPSISSIRPNRS